MSSSIKDRISTDLERAKSEGSLRTERIRSIVRDAIRQSSTELRAGTSEIRLIAKDAISAVLAVIGDRSQDVKDEISASVEGIVEGVRSRQQETIAQTQTQIDQLQAQVETEEQQLENDVNAALTEIQTTADQTPTDLKTRIYEAVDSLRERDEYEWLQQQADRLRLQLNQLDQQISERYGDRYDEVKRQFEGAKNWYETKRTEVEATGVNPVEQKQEQAQHRLSNVGAAVARKEEQIKLLLKELVQTVTQKQPTK